jgi:hypothetical protein
LKELEGISGGKGLPPTRPILGKLAGEQEGVELFLQNNGKRGIVWAFLRENKDDYGIIFF